MNESNPTMISSPCISNCCLDQQDVCVGCFRHIDEITGWHGADNQQRLQILSNCEQRRKVSKNSFFSPKTRQ